MQTIAEAVDLFGRFPTNDVLKSTIQVLIGQYALTTGDFQAAVKHFRLAAAVRPSVKHKSFKLRFQGFTTFELCELKLAVGALFCLAGSSAFIFLPHLFASSPKLVLNISGPL